jgi:hypothetical protein
MTRPRMTIWQTEPMKPWHHKPEPQPEGTHTVTLTVTLTMSEMDGTPDESANIAGNILSDLIREHTCWVETHMGILSASEA